MPPNNIELFQRAAEAWDRGDLPRLLSFYDADIEMDFTRFEGWVERATFRGHAEVRAFLEQWRAPFTDYRFEVERYAEADDRVLALCSQSGSGFGSTGLAMMRLAQIATFEDGLITRLENYSNRADALEELGLTE